MNNELLATLEYIEQERGISKAQLIAAVERALLSASRKSIHPASDLSVKLNPRTGELRAWAKLKVVDAFPGNDEITLEEVQKKMPDVQLGDIIDWEVTPRNFGRIAASSARQAILQHIKDAEKATVQEEFKEFVGSIVSGTVRRIDAGKVIVDLQTAEGVLAGVDRIPMEQYGPGDRLNALLLKIDDKASPSLILSRSHEDFLKKLFEREVSEIHDGVVEIVGVAREAGSRAKIAVRSNDSRVDPVGACVGMRGMRVKNITGELGGERVDIIHYTDNFEEFVRNVMHPAKILHMDIDRIKKQLTVYVDPENSRLASGKRGLNVRLAQRLLNWRIVLVTEDPQAEFEEMKAQAVEDLAAALDVSSETAEILVNKGYLNVEGLRADADNLEAVAGLSADDIQAIRSALEN